jgi:hypothetical protein
MGGWGDGDERMGIRAGEQDVMPSPDGSLERSGWQVRLQHPRRAIADLPRPSPLLLAILANNLELSLTPQLSGTEEIENGKSNGQLGEVFIRCNNVLYIR